ncbi:hypothetical protein MASR2M78_04900 [Treponema sp.]
MKRQSQAALLLLIIVLISSPRLYLLSAEQLSSPRWGFHIDMPENYNYVSGDSLNLFSFALQIGKENASVDLVVYEAARFTSVESLAADTVKKLKADAEISPFSYKGRGAVLLNLSFEALGKNQSGWALCIELDTQNTGSQPPLLLALSYAPSSIEGMEAFHLSVLDSISPSAAQLNSSGPVSAFAFPRTQRSLYSIKGLKSQASFDKSDGAAAKALIDREFRVLSSYSKSPQWKEAWARFYRAIHKDSYERLADLAFQVERELSVGLDSSERNRKLAEKALEWVQDFRYERDLMGSDFVDLVSAALEGRGDCDSRALLYAIILERAGINAAIMVSRDYGHAMALVDVEGSGARFSFANTSYLVAETTAKVALGMIGSTQSDSAKWLGVRLE